MHKIMLPKLFSILIVSILLIGAGCQKVDNTNLVNFEKKKDCAQYKNDLEKQATDSKENLYILKKIFYSPKRDSCLYITHEGYTVGKERVEMFTLYDYLTNENLITVQVKSFAELEERENEFNRLTKDFE